MTEGSKTSREERDRDLFDTIAENYTAKDLYEPSRIARAMRVTKTFSKSDVSNNAHILEIGCGAGFGAKYLREEYVKYTGLDYSKELINKARQLFESENVSFYATNLFDFTSKHLYDVILMIGVLHHISDQPAAIRRSFELLKPGGFLVINEPQAANPIFRFLRGVRTKVSTEYSEEQDQVDAEELVALFRESGFTEVRSYPQGLFSTPFAEVMLQPQLITSFISRASCAIDTFLEKNLKNILGKLTWNIIVSGQKPY